MKEKLKTILLFILVGSSLMMTQQLWMKLPKGITGILPSQASSYTSYNISDMIAPNKYLITFGQNLKTMLYDANKYGMWNYSRIAISSALSSRSIRTEELKNDYKPEQSGERMVTFYFPERMSTYILTKAWDVDNPNSIMDTIPNIEKISIGLGSGNPFFVFSGEGKNLKVTDSAIDFTNVVNEILRIEGLKEYDYYYSLSEVFETTQDDIFIPYEIKQFLPIVYVSNDVSEMTNPEKNQLAERFLGKNIDYIRQIVESNGSTIYIYDNKVLKFNQNGTIEYFHSLEESISERNLYLSLVTASEFISTKALSAKGMYLARTEEISSEGNLGYRFTFRYRIRGIPVLLGNKEVQEYVQIEAFNNQVRSYKQLFRTETEISISNLIDRRRILTSFDVIDRNYQFLENKYLEYSGQSRIEYGDDLTQMVLSSIEDITISFFDPNLKDREERLIGVWQIRAHGKVYAFNAYTGSLVYER